MYFVGQHKAINLSILTWDLIFIYCGVCYELYRILAVLLEVIPPPPCADHQTCVQGITTCLQRGGGAVESLLVKKLAVVYLDLSYGSFYLFLAVITDKSHKYSNV